jgi:hypothetical protein
MKKKILKKILKEEIRELPVNLSILGLALILGLAERGVAAISEILEGPGRGISKSYRKISEMKDYWDYYGELKDFKENSARTILWRLQNKGLVRKKGKNYELTVLGLKIAKIFRDKKFVEKVWDGKWRIVMFDIPEKKRQQRNWLRFELYTLDYKPLQKSVFMGQQPIDEDIYQEIMERGLHNYIRLITVGEIDDDEILEQFSRI